MGFCHWLVPSYAPGSDLIRRAGVFSSAFLYAFFEVQEYTSRFLFSFLITNLPSSDTIFHFCLCFMIPFGVFVIYFLWPWPRRTKFGTILFPWIELYVCTKTKELISHCSYSLICHTQVGVAIRHNCRLCELDSCKRRLGLINKKGVFVFGSRLYSHREILRRPRFTLLL